MLTGAETNQTATAFSAGGDASKTQQTAGVSTTAGMNATQ